MKQEHKDGAPTERTSEQEDASLSAGRSEADSLENVGQFEGVGAEHGDCVRPLPGTTIEFSFSGQKVRTLFREGETWFVAADVCAVLEHTDPSKATSRLDDDEKGATTVRTLGGEQQMNIVSESGLYALIFTSRKPQAKAFRRWVTGEVLPSIRKTGRYQMLGAPEAPHLNRGGATSVNLPHYGRFSVMNLPDGIHLNSAEWAIASDFDAIDCRILAHQTKVIEGLWERYRQVRSTGQERRDGFSFTALGQAILESGQLAQRTLGQFQQRRAQPEAARRDTASSPSNPHADEEANPHDDGNGGRRSRRLN